MIDPSVVLRRIVRVMVRGQRNAKGESQDRILNKIMPGVEGHRVVSSPPDSDLRKFG